MAHPVKRVTNEQVLDALRLLGINLTGPIDMTGAQNSAFRFRLLPLIQSQLPSGEIADRVFDKAITAAKDVAAISADAPMFDRLYGYLRAYGMTDDQYARVVEEAKKIRRNAGPGIYDPSKEFNENEFFQAAVNVIGRTPATERIAGITGMQMPDATTGPTPAPAAPGPAPSPAQEAFRAGERGTVNQAPPAAMKPPASTMGPGPATGAGGAPAPGAGGGANNQPPPPSTWNDDQIRDFIKQNFGSNAYFIDIPEVWDALKSVVKSGKGAAGLQSAIEGTNFWRQNKSNARSWYVKERADPAQAAADVALQAQAIQNLADQAGITINPDRVQAMAQSYLRYGWSQTDLQRAIGAEWHYDPTSKNQAAAVSKMKQDARNWLVPLSDQAIQTWGQGLISGTTTDAAWQQYLRDNARSLFPQLNNLIDQHQGDANFTLDTFVDPYKQQAANLLGINTDEIDMSDPKWRRALDVVDPKTNTRRIMTLDEWSSTVKTDQTYGYDKSARGINEALNLATTLKASLGF